MKTIRLAFVGVGSMGQCAHLRNYVINPACEVVALADLREGLARKVAARYGVGRVYASGRELLDGESGLDGIVAIQGYGVHGRLVPELLEAGPPVLIEKPLARSVEAGEKILAAQRRTRSRLYVAYHKRSDPATELCRKQIDEWKRSGEMGPMRYVRVSMPPGDWRAGGFGHLITTDEPRPQLDQDPPAADLSEADAARLDTFVNYYIHQLNLMRHLLGEGYRLRYADRSGVLLAAESESGVTAVLEMDTYRTTTDWQEQALVTFEKGWVRLDLPAPMAVDRPGRVTVFRDPGEGRRPETTAAHLPQVHAMRRQAENFLAAVRGEPTALCEAEESLADLRAAREYIDLLGRAKVRPPE